MDRKITLYDDNNWYYFKNNEGIRIPKVARELMRSFINKLRQWDEIEQQALNLALQDIDNREVRVRLIQYQINRMYHRNEVENEFKKQLNLLSRA